MKPSNYLEGLNSLRFFAAALVVIGHGHHHTYTMGIPFAKNIAFFGNAGKSVDFFFVLSGFLLTYLTLTEISKEGKMNLRYFYMRRVLRIMPLYYLVLFTSLFLYLILVPYLTGNFILGFPPIEGGLFFFFMLPNLVSPIWPDTVGGINLLWSIGVEEQFYLLFPFIILLIARAKRKIITVLSLLFAYTILYWTIQFKLIPVSDVFRLFARSLRFHFMLTGMLLAVLIHPYSRKSEKLEQISNNLGLQLIISLLLIFEIFYGLDLILPLQHIYLSLLFAFTILITSSASNKRWFSLEIEPLSYWGTISYGIYLLHPLTSYGLRFFIEKIPLLDAGIRAFPSLYIILLLACTMLFAHFSYQYFEGYFLKKKKNYK